MSETKNSTENTENTENREAINITIDTVESPETESEIKTETVGAVENPENTDGQNSENEQNPFINANKSKDEQSAFKNSVFGTAVILGIVTVVMVLAISVVNTFASPVIEKRLAGEKDKSIKNLFGWDVYTEVLTGFEIPAPATEVIAVYDSSTKELAGYCVTVEPKGYGGKIIMLVAVNPDITVRDTQILSMSETAGYGAKLDDEREKWFREQFISRTPDIKDIRTKPLPGENSIQIIAGATVSSKAFLNGINSALDVAGEISRQKAQITETQQPGESGESGETEETEETPENVGEWEVN